MLRSYLFNESWKLSQITSNLNFLCIEENYNVLSPRFIGEESVAAGEKSELTDAPTWIIDPVDGTMNFVHSFPYSCISLAVLHKKITQIGIIYNPILNQMYTAKLGQGAYLNEKPIFVSQEKGISERNFLLKGTRPI